MRKSAWLALVLVGATVAVPTAGCTDDASLSSPAAPSSHPLPGQPPPGPQRSGPPPAGDCPVTLPEPVRDPAAGQFLGSETSFGNGRLWVGSLRPDGVISADAAVVRSDGSSAVKFGWWRAVPGDLLISGRRLDAVAPALRADVPSGYGERGFQATGVIFPTPGCWQVTGRVGDATLTFYTFVGKPSGPSATA